MALLRTAGPFLVCAALTTAAAIATPQPAPRLVSPGNDRQEGRVGSACPTFSWASAHGSTGYALVVYEASSVAEAAGRTSSKPLLEIELPDGALSWTPSLGECLPGAGQYSWAVGARGEDGEIHWSTPTIFRVIAPAAPREPEPHQPATTSALDGGSAPVVQRATPAGAAASLPGSLPPRSLSAEAFSPPTCSESFTDVTIGNPLCAWVEQSSTDQIVTECAGGKYCPDNPVTRAQFALFAQRIMRGTDTWRREAGDGAAPNLPPGLPTFTLLDASSIFGLTSVTIGADGLGLIGYSDISTFNLTVAHCSNVNCTAATKTTLDSPGFVGSYPSITIGADGLGLISYYDQTNGDLKVAHCTNVNCTSATKTILDDPAVEAVDVGLHTSVAIGADGRGLISYYDTTNDDLKVAHCVDLECTGTTVPPTPLDTAGDVGQSSSLTIGADGLGLISYYDATNDDLKVAHCDDLECTSATITTIDNPAVETVDVGQYTSITIGADGLGLISYYDFTNGDLKVAHCANVDCSAATFAPVDTSPDVGLTTSITIGADGLGLISYFANPTDDLKVAHCSNVNCTAATITPLDTAGPVGLFTSVTIGADGLGLISYWDGTNPGGGLKVAHCSNVLCAPYFRRR